MKTRSLFGVQSPGRIVLFSSRGKSYAKKADGNGNGNNRNGAERINAQPIIQPKIIDLAALSAWYAAQNEDNERSKEWTMPRFYAEKQRNLRFLTL